MRSVAQRGQATVEHIGLGVVVVLLLAATTAWLLPMAQRPAPPPDVFAELERPLAEAGAAIQAAGNDLQRLLGAQGGRAAPLARALRAVGRGVAAGVVIAAEVPEAFAYGVTDSLREEVREMVRDPLAMLTLPAAEVALGPAAVLALAVERRRQVAAYVRYVGSLPPREAAAVVAYDIGDFTVEAGLALLRQRVNQAISERYSTVRTRPEDAPPSPLDGLFPSGPAPTSRQPHEGGTR